MDNMICGYHSDDSIMPQAAELRFSKNGFSIDYESKSRIIQYNEIKKISLIKVSLFGEKLLNFDVRSQPRFQLGVQNIKFLVEYLQKQNAKTIVSIAHIPLGLQLTYLYWLILTLGSAGLYIYFSSSYSAIHSSLMVILFSYLVSVPFSVYLNKILSDLPTVTMRVKKILTILLWSIPVVGLGIAVTFLRKKAIFTKNLEGTTEYCLPPQKTPAILVIVSAWLTTMLFNHAIDLLSLTQIGQQVGEAVPSFFRIVLFVLYFVFWISRLRYAKHSTIYLVYLVLISDVLLYLVGLDVIKQGQNAPLSSLFIAVLQVVGAVVGVGTIVFVKKFHKMGWLVVASLLSVCFILGGFIPLLLDHNTFRSLIWLVVVEFALVIYLSYTFRKREAN